VFGWSIIYEETLRNLQISQINKSRLKKFLSDYAVALVKPATGPSHYAGDEDLQRLPSDSSVAASWDSALHRCIASRGTSTTGHRGFEISSVGPTFFTMALRRSKLRSVVLGGLILLFFLLKI
jgi:hypothetical protein